MSPFKSVVKPPPDQKPQDQTQEPSDEQLYDLYVKYVNETQLLLVKRDDRVHRRRSIVSITSPIPHWKHNNILTEMTQEERQSYFRWLQVGPQANMDAELKEVIDSLRPPSLIQRFIARFMSPDDNRQQPWER